MNDKDSFYKVQIGSFGDYLREEWLEPLNLSSYSLAKSIGISTAAMSKILSGKNKMSDDTGWRLARFFGVSKGYFLGIQSAFIERNAADAFDKEVENLPVFNWNSVKYRPSLA